MLKCVQPAQRSSAANGPWRRLLIASPEFPTEKEEGRKEGRREGGRNSLLLPAAFRYARAAAAGAAAYEANRYASWKVAALFPLSRLRIPIFNGIGPIVIVSIHLLVDSTKYKVLFAVQNSRIFYDGVGSTKSSIIQQ